MPPFFTTAQRGHSMLRKELMHLSAQAQPRSRSTMAQVAGAKRAQERPAQAARHVGWSSGSAVAAAASARSIVAIVIVVWLPLVSWRAQQGTASKAGLARCRPLASQIRSMRPGDGWNVLGGTALAEYCTGFSAFIHGVLLPDPTVKT